MKTVTYSSVLQQAVEYTGRVYSDLTNEEAVLFRGHIRTALRKIWEAFPWPETLAVQKEYFGILPDYNEGGYAKRSVYYNVYDGEYYQTLAEWSPFSAFPPTDTDGVATNVGFSFKLSDIDSATNFDVTLPYDPGVVVFFEENQKYYCSTSGGAIEGYTPLTQIYEAWVEVTPFVREIDKLLNKDGTERDQEIGEIVRITAEDPRGTNNITSVDYYLSGDTITVTNDLPYVWVEYRTVPPRFDSDPDTIPYRFAEYVAQRAAGLVHIADGKADLGRALVELSVETMQDECDKVSLQEGQVRRVTVLTR